jgi:hypothetical protein
MVLSIAKAFRFSPGGDSGWGYRVAEATPRFCRTCFERHHANAQPVTGLDRLKSLVSSELIIPAVGLGAFAGLVLINSVGRLLRRPAGEWPIAAFAAVLILIALHCLRSAWAGNAHKRVPIQTEITRSFDFGDDDDSAFQQTARIYALRHEGYAIALRRLNAAGDEGV